MEEEALAGAPDVVLPVGYIGRPGIAEHGKHLFPQARETGEVLAQLQIRELMIDYLFEEILLVGDLFFRTYLRDR